MRLSLFSRRPYWIACSLALLLPLLVGVTSLFVHSRKSRDALQTSLTLWSSQLGKALIDENWLLVANISRSLNLNDFSQVKVLKDRRTVFSFPSSDIENRCSEESSYPINHYGQEVGVVRYCQTWSKQITSALRSETFLIGLTVAVVLILFSLFLPLLHYRKSLKGALNVLEDWAKNTKESLGVQPNQGSNDPVVMKFVKIIQTILDDQMRLQKKMDELDKLAELSELAKRVSHDIRSPLSALNIVASHLKQIPEEQRNLIRNAVNRINDIANTLLKRALDTKKLGEGGGNQIRGSVGPSSSVQLLSAIVGTLVSEKRVQFQDKPGIRIEVDYGNAMGTFVYLDSSEVKRTLSNLINNSVEAFDETGSRGNIDVSLNVDRDQVVVCIRDNGKGIRGELLQKLGQIEISEGKDGHQSGSGLGIYHAKRMTEAFDGRFVISSKEQCGTSITMEFPTVDPPVWFLNDVTLNPNMTIVSVDDDPSIHSVWGNRLSASELKKNGIVHLSFSEQERFQLWWQNRRAAGSSSSSSLQDFDNTLFLMDYEFMNARASGLDLVESLGIAQMSILVTHRYEDPSVQNLCLHLGLKILPKELLSSVGITCSKNNRISNFKARPFLWSVLD